MHAFDIVRIKNIIVWGSKLDLNKEMSEISESINFKLYYAMSLDEFRKILEFSIIHLIIIDSLFGVERVSEILEFFHKEGYAHIPMILMMDEESIEHRCEFFTKGISSFYQKGSNERLVDTIKKLERDLSFEEGLKSMSVAVLDDDRLQLAILKDILTRNSVLNVDFYDNPKQLLLSDKSYDVYLIDLILPDIDGEIVMLEMRKKNESAVIIGISSIEKKSTIARVLSIGANDYISKPVNEQVFMAKLYSNSRILILLRENEMKNHILQEMAIRDGLTNLYNHKHVHELLEINIKLAKRYSKSLSLAMIDIDDFKNVNDTYGHQFGDTVLAEVANCITRTVRDSDVVGRYGGEEFIIIFPETNKEEAIVISNRIRIEIGKLIFKRKVKVTVSGGISEFVASTKQLIYDADQLLYRAKQSGKNKIDCDITFKDQSS